MHRRMIIFIMHQKKFLSRSSTADHQEMTIYKENSQISKSLVRYEDKNKILLQIGDLRNIQNGYSRILFLFKSNLFVFFNDSFSKSAPIIEERPDDDKIPVIGFTDLLRWMVKTKDSDGKDTVNTGGRLGRLDAANEAGFFHRTERSRLKELKKKVKDKVKNLTEPKKTG